MPDARYLLSLLRDRDASKSAKFCSLIIEENEYLAPSAYLRDTFEGMCTRDASHLFLEVRQLQGELGHRRRPFAIRSGQ